MARICDKCGYRMPMWTPRMRADDGALLCPGCHPKGKGSEGRPIGLHGSSTTPILACESCATPMGEAGLVVEAGKFVCPDGCKTAGIDPHNLHCSNCGHDWVEDRGGTLMGPGPVPIGAFDCPECRMTGKVQDRGPVTAKGSRKVAAFPPGSPAANVRAFEQAPVNQWFRDHEGADCLVLPDGSYGCVRQDDENTGHIFCDVEFADGSIDENTFADEASARRWVETALYSRKSASRKTAHDSGDGATIFHCPFCGSGQVTGRSDGTAECDFCHTAFTVQVQPEMAAMPQTVNGQPSPIPGMPGDHTQPAQEAPGAAPEAPVAGPAFVPPDKGNAFVAPATVAASKPSPFYLTADQVALPEESYLRHLAIKHADDRDAVIAQVKAER